VKDDRLYLRHILDAIDDVLAYSAAGRQAFFDERIRQDAVIRKIEVIGEAANTSPKRLAARVRMCGGEKSRA
jgi:uncharacterized protein with HEPN domain